MSKTLRDRLLARRATAPRFGCTPVPCPDCPEPDTFVARLTAARLYEYWDALEGKTPADQAAVRLRFACVNADGSPVFGPDDDLSAIDGEVAMAVIGEFHRANGMTEKKPTPAASSPAGSPPASA